ncbi:MAG: hypothetical protein E7I27_27795, partial [Klebsiella michiganensis]|nr:hypothetical protein [Klebsiella michiganensis]
AQTAALTSILAPLSGGDVVPMGYIIKILICVHIPLKITPESTKTLYCPPMQFANMLPDSLLWPSGGEDLSPLAHARND